MNPPADPDAPRPRKTARSVPADQDPPTPPGDASRRDPEEGAEAAGPRGLNWLRHAGVGPRRSSDKKISGAAVTSLGSLEAELMGLLWEIGRPANGMEVAEASLYKRRAAGEEPIAFSTVNTTLRRLADKGVLVSRKGETRTPYYAPTVGREEMAARILNNVSETLLGNSLHGLIPRLTGGLRRGKQAGQDREQEMVERLLSALEKAAEGRSDPGGGDPGGGDPDGE